MSQSTNDSIPTATHIALLSLIEKLLISMNELSEAFYQKSKEFDKVIKIGRTHLQDAVPIRLGQEFEAYNRVLNRDIKRIKQTFTHLYEVNMGATAIGTSLNADSQYKKAVIQVLAKESGFPLISSTHLVDATQNTDAYTEVSGALKICMINI
jgi:aspartate ammonia-lyase